MAQPKIGIRSGLFGRNKRKFVFIVSAVTLIAAAYLLVNKNTFKADTVGPNVVITNPLDGTTLKIGQTYPITISRGTVSNISKIEVFANNYSSVSVPVPNCVLTTAPYVCNWTVNDYKYSTKMYNNTSKGWAITAYVYDSAGNLYVKSSYGPMVNGGGGSSKK